MLTDLTENNLYRGWMDGARVPDDNSFSPSLDFVAIR